VNVKLLFLTMGEEHRLKVSKIPRKIFGYTRDEVIGQRTTLQNFSSLCDWIKKIRCVGYVA
jgi:hypothetical protein